MPEVLKGLVPGSTYEATIRECNGIWRKYALWCSLANVLLSLLALGGFTVAVVGLVEASLDVSGATALALSAVAVLLLASIAIAVRAVSMNGLLGGCCCTTSSR